jgi:GrpB-like predicted nucleotidyltransferase (UPF0157 family)
MDAEMLQQIQHMLTTAVEGLRSDIRQDMAVMERNLREEIVEGKRHAGVLVEGLRHELQLVAEGLQMHIEQRHREDRAYMDHQFQETRALIHLSYSQLNERVTRLEQRNP